MTHLCFPSVLWHCWFGGRKGFRPVKNWVVGAGMVICLEWDADLHMAQLMPLPLTVCCFSKIQISFTFLVPAHLGSPGKGPLNGCVCDPCVFVVRLVAGQPQSRTIPQRLESNVYCIGAVAYGSLHYDKQRLRQNCQFLFTPYLKLLLL